MNIFGVVCLLCCLILGVLSFQYHKRGALNISIVLLLCLGFCLRAYTSLDLYLHCWDERYHALVAKNMMQNPLSPYLYRIALLPYHYTSWTNNQVWLHKQPLSLWIMAFGMKCFGINEYALRLPSIITSTLSIGLIYQVGAYFFSKKVAFLAAFFFAVNGLIIEVCSGRVATDHPDTLFLFFVLLAVFFTIKFILQEKNIFTVAAGLSLGAALLTKWLPALIVLPIWFMLVYASEKYTAKQITAHLLLIVLIAMIVFLPWQVYIHFYFPQEALWERSYNTRHFWETLEGQGGAWYYYLNRIRIDYGELIYLPVIWVLYQYMRNKKDLKLLALIIWFVIPIVFFSCAATKMNGYMLIASPALFIISAAFFYAVKHTMTDARFNWLIQLIMISMIVLSVRYCIERIKPFERKGRNPEWVSDLKKWHQRNNPKAVLFGYNAPIEAMFYTEAIVYETIPATSVMDSIQKSGFDVFVNESAILSSEIKQMKNVSIVHLKNAEF